jgi:hypothetical protein
LTVQAKSKLDTKFWESRIQDEWSTTEFSSVMRSTTEMLYIIPPPHIAKVSFQFARIILIPGIDVELNSRAVFTSISN